MALCLTLRLAVFMALLPALGATAWVAIRGLAPKISVVALVACTGAATLFLNVITPLFLHYAGATINGVNLARSHWAWFLAVLLLASRRRHRTATPAASGFRARDWFGLLVPAVLWAVVVFPFTHLAGIDTYKWQDVASGIILEGRILWMLHPVGLLGFMPRAYPAAQPLLLTTIALLSGLGVDGSWYLCSVFTGTLGLASAAFLGKRFLRDSGWAAAVAMFYVFSPVFMRYGHWATGRGLFLAVMPLALAAIFEPAARRAWSGWAVTGILLLLCHKTALVAVPLLAVVRLAGVWMPRRRITAMIVAGGMLAVITLLIGGAGRLSLAGVRSAVLLAGTRFGWMAVAVLPAAWVAAGRLASPATRRLLLLLALSLPWALLRDMYGALIALAPLTLTVVTAGRKLCERFPRHRKRLVSVAVALSLLASTAIIVQRSRAATSPAVRAAAAFLDAYDPHGPFRVLAPGRVATQIQAYVRGCPRFNLTRHGKPKIRLLSPPVGRMLSLPAFARAWTAYLRRPFVLDGVGVDWYGRSPRMYYVQVNGRGSIPGNAVRIYAKDGVAVFMPLGQEITLSP